MKQIKAVIVGNGNRAGVYSELALTKPEKLKIVGVVDPDEVRVKAAKDKFDIPGENCFSSLERFLKREKFADAVLNCTMDKLHVKTSVPILEKGYDMLLEKPFALNKDELEKIVKTANRTGRKVYICHVLRYTPFYSAIKKAVASGEIGKIISMELCEHVSYHHMAVSYVRGKWRSEKLCFAPMLLAKSCHDIDIMMWMMDGVKPVKAASFGGEFQFGVANKPEGAGSRCMTDCPLNKECIFSAERNYIDNPERWGQYVWTCLEAENDFSIERKIKSLKTDNPYGKCVWDFERDGNVDHQSVIVSFENGVTATFNMVGGSARPERNIHIVGTLGEIKGCFEDSKYIIRHIKPSGTLEYTEEVFDLNITGDMTGAFGGHGGGDLRLVEDFVDSLSGKEPSISCTDINDSVLSHATVFAAVESMKKGTVEKIDVNF